MLNINIRAGEFQDLYEQLEEKYPPKRAKENLNALVVHSAMACFEKKQKESPPAPVLMTQQPGQQPAHAGPSTLGLESSGAPAEAMNMPAAAAPAAAAPAAATLSVPESGTSSGRAENGNVSVPAAKASAVAGTASAVVARSTSALDVHPGDSVANPSSTSGPAASTAPVVAETAPSTSAAIEKRTNRRVADGTETAREAGASSSSESHSSATMVVNSGAGSSTTPLVSAPTVFSPPEAATDTSVGVPGLATNNDEYLTTTAATSSGEQQASEVAGPGVAASSNLTASSSGSVPAGEQVDAAVSLQTIRPPPGAPVTQVRLQLLPLPPQSTVRNTAWRPFPVPVPDEIGRAIYKFLPEPPVFTQVDKLLRNDVILGLQVTDGMRTWYPKVKSYKEGLDPFIVDFADDVPVRLSFLQHDFVNGQPASKLCLRFKIHAHGDGYYIYLQEFAHWTDLQGGFMLKFKSIRHAGTVVKLIVRFTPDDVDKDDVDKNNFYDHHPVNLVTEIAKYGCDGIAEVTKHLPGVERVYDGRRSTLTIERYHMDFKEAFPGYHRRRTQRMLDAAKIPMRSQETDNTISPELVESDETNALLAARFQPFAHDLANAEPGFPKTFGDSKAKVPTNTFRLFPRVDRRSAEVLFQTGVVSDVIPIKLAQSLASTEPALLSSVSFHFRPNPLSANEDYGKEGVVAETGMRIIPRADPYFFLHGCDGSLAVAFPEIGFTQASFTDLSEIESLKYCYVGGRRRLNLVGKKYDTRGATSARWSYRDNRSKRRDRRFSRPPTALIFRTEDGVEPALSLFVRVQDEKLCNITLYSPPLPKKGKKLAVKMLSTLCTNHGGTSSTATGPCSKQKLQCIAALYVLDVGAQFWDREKQVVTLPTYARFASFGSKEELVYALRAVLGVNKGLEGYQERFNLGSFKSAKFLAEGGSELSPADRERQPENYTEALRLRRGDELAVLGVCGTKEEVEKKYGPLREWDLGHCTDLSCLYMWTLLDPMYDVFAQNDMENLGVLHAQSPGRLYVWAPICFMSYDKNPDISCWNTSKVTNMYRCFWNWDDFNQPLTGWDTSSVTSMNEMFYGAIKFDQPLGHFDLSNLGSLFAESASPCPAVGHYNDGGLQDMLRGAANFKQWESLRSWSPDANKLGQQIPVEPEARCSFLFDLVNKEKNAVEKMGCGAYLMQRVPVDLL
ncbi:unnamed protein product [Amoebophrya sp. A120]|nr:unnamed protein product [Amoebophrya sp. A120]|eukprot:GSA120T00025363001.1